MSEPMRETPDEIRETQPGAFGASPVAGLIRVVTAPWGERTFLRVYCIAILMAVFLSFTGAVNTGGLDAGARLTYWLVVMLGGSVAMQCVSAVVERFVKLEPLPEAVTLFVLGCPVILIVVWSLTAVLGGRTPNLGNLGFYVTPVIAVTGAMSILQYVLHHQPMQSHAPAATAPVVSAPSAFRERLPFKFRQADIHALSAEDHYLRVYTSAGETLVLMRLYDAIPQLGIEGSQTHRSWWVAKDAVRDITRADGRISLILPDNVSAPVSRTYAPALKAGGWL